MRLDHIDRMEKNLVYRIRWDYLRFECSPSSLLNTALGEKCPQREMAREIIEIIYNELKRNGEQK